jgi:methyl-accepting chemotaxis protein
VLSPAIHSKTVPDTYGNAAFADRCIARNEGLDLTLARHPPITICELLGNDTHSSHAHGISRTFFQTGFLLSVMNKYGLKLTVGYVTTGLMIVTVGLVTGSGVSAAVAACAGLLTLGSVVGTMTTTTLKDLRRQTTALAQGNLDQSLTSHRADEFGDLYRAVDELRQSLQKRIAEAEAAQRRAETLAAQYTQVAQQYAQTMQAAAQGDLTQRIAVHEELDAMTTIGRGFNRTMEDLEAAVAGVRRFADVFEEDIARVGTVTTASKESICAVREVSDEINQTSRAQKKELQKAADEMRELSSGTEEIAATALQLADTTEKAARTGIQARDQASEAADVMQTIQEDAGRAVDHIKSLSSTTAEMTNIVGMIQDIAQQTNMLALNASIEAARAGADSTSKTRGLGFGVVADEVKSLAEKTQDHADQIADMIAELREKTQRATSTIESTSQQVEMGTDTVRDAIGRMEAIVESVTDIETAVSGISHATDDQARATENTNTTIERVVSTSTDTVGRAVDVSEAVERQVAAFDEITGSVQRFENTVEEMVDHLRTFTVSTTDEAVHPSTPERSALQMTGRISNGGFAHANETGDEMSASDASPELHPRS